MRAMDPESGLLFNQQEYQRYLMIRGCTFEHTKIFDLNLLNSTGMNVEFNSVFSTIGWQGFWKYADELEIKLLTIEFLCSLQVFHDGVYFRMFNQDFNLPWSQLNIVIGFDEAWLLDTHLATRRFKKAEFWEAITTSHDCSKPNPNKIHNPTLCFLHHWMSITLFPQHVVRPLKIEELKLLYAMSHKIRV